MDKVKLIAIDEKVLFDDPEVNFPRGGSSHAAVFTGVQGADTQAMLKEHQKILSEAGNVILNSTKVRIPDIHDAKTFTHFDRTRKMDLGTYYPNAKIIAVNNMEELKEKFKILAEERIRQKLGLRNNPIDRAIG